MSSSVKSKDRSSSAGQKFWHLKKLALGKANNNSNNNSNSSSQPLQRPPSPAESAYSIDTMSMCDDVGAKTRSKRLSVLLSHRRQSGGGGSSNKVSPAKGGAMSSAMSVQNIQVLSSNASIQNNNSLRCSNTPSRPSIRQRTVSHTTGATSANDTRASFLRTRHNAEQQQHPTLTRHSSVKEQQRGGAHSRPHEDDNSNSNFRRPARGLRPAASLANLRSATSSRYDDQQSPPLSPSSPRSQQQQQSPVLSPIAGRPSSMVGGRSSKPPTPRNSQPPTPRSPAMKESHQQSEESSELGWSSQEDVVKDDDSLSSDESEGNKGSGEYWQRKLEKERAVIKALQRQKEACNKDITFLSQSVDELTNEKQEWKQKYEHEKTYKGRIQDDLASTTNKLNDAREQVRTLVTENDQLRAELQEQKQKFDDEMQKTETDPNHKTLQAQLRHSQDQVRVLKATMEQFLRMGIFSEDVSVYQNIASRYGTQLKASPVECLVEQQQQQQQQRQQAQRQQEAPPTPPSPAAETTYSDQRLQKQAQEPAQSSQQRREIKSPADLDAVLLELLREKELLQSEYSKIPVSGANALARRRKEELESRLDELDSQMSKTKLKHRALFKK